MTDLVRVRDKRGHETTVGRAWLTRWPDDFEEVKSSPTPVGDQEKPVEETVSKARTGRKRKG